ncbi:endonuclease domain-containing protein [Mycolicibacterium palauense]|uniref:endonuclease domain-containing protein n=1 Tax=Mycolicibacterium palauense TaxID=2034511 RepID=UPI000BFF1169|nr:DUF559 domain-containing protein [Mycolicibacterium palauense]
MPSEPAAAGLDVSALPADRVVGVLGPDPEQFSVGLDPLPADAPVVIGYQVTAEGEPTPAGSRSVVSEVLAVLESAVRDLFPAWLPGAPAGSGSDFDRRTARRLGRIAGSRSPHFGPLLADLADAALAGRPLRGGYDPAHLGRGLAALLAETYGRDGVVIALHRQHVGAGADREADRDVVATAAEWLANHVGVGVWLLGDLARDSDRIPLVSVLVPDYLRTLQRPRAGAGAGLATVPALVGRPHPGSAVEQAVEAALGRCAWAHGRTWNQTHWGGRRFLPPLRVDLMWPRERVVVELDGPDHRGALKYADDRRRDNTLVLAGFAVLRFTNDEVSADLSRTLAMIEELLAARRSDEGMHT